MHDAKNFAEISLGLREEQSRGAPPSGSRGWLHWGALCVVVALVILERMQPFYFTRDDVFAIELPAMLQRCRSFFEGVFPSWNPYQFMGTPIARLGYSSLAYPPAYAAYFIAHYLLQNEYASMEVFSILHICAGYFVMFWMLRTAGVRPALAMAGSLCFVLSGCTLIGGRSWQMMVTVVVWAPLLMSAVLRVEQGPVTWKWVAGTGAVIGIFYHAGIPQMWMYGLLFFLLAIGILVLTGRVPASRALWSIPAVASGLALAAPLLVPQLSFLSDLERTRAYGIGILGGLWSMLLPSPLVRSPHPCAWGNSFVETMGQFYYSGTLFLLMDCIAAVFIAIYFWRREVWRRNVWVIVSAIAFLIALGYQGGLWIALCKIPVFGKINNYPFRVMPYLNLFIVLGGALVLERLFNAARKPRVWEWSVGIGMSALVLYHVSICKTSFYSYCGSPYPTMPEAMARLLESTGAPQRIFPMAFERSAEPNYALSLMHGFPSVYSIMSCNGYDPIIESKPRYKRMAQRLRDDPVGAARAYGVQWIVIHRFYEEFTYDPRTNYYRSDILAKYSPAVRDRLLSAARKRLVLPEVSIWELPMPSPMAFCEAPPQLTLPVAFNGRGATVDLAGVSGGARVVVNIIGWPEMTAYADGVRVRTGEDAWGRLRVAVPPGAKALEVRYPVSSRLGLWVGVFLILPVVPLVAVSSRLRSAQRSTNFRNVVL